MVVCLMEMQWWKLDSRPGPSRTVVQGSTVVSLLIIGAPHVGKFVLSKRSSGHVALLVTTP